DLGIAFHELALGERKRAGKAHIEADGLKDVHAHQAQVKLLLELVQIDFVWLTIDDVLARTQLRIQHGLANEIIIEKRNIARARTDVLVTHDIVKNHRRIVDDVAKNMRV